jgi:hypothetical protein
MIGIDAVGVSFAHGGHHVEVAVGRLVRAQPEEELAVLLEPGCSTCSRGLQLRWHSRSG